METWSALWNVSLQVMNSDCDVGGASSHFPPPSQSKELEEKISTVFSLLSSSFRKNLKISEKELKISIPSHGTMLMMEMKSLSVSIIAQFSFSQSAYSLLHKGILPPPSTPCHLLQ